VTNYKCVGIVEVRRFNLLVFMIPWVFAYLP
jgi:hypothetical protein